MKKAEVKKIIAEYKPHKGFFDLSVKPSTITDKEYAEILNAQNFIAEQNKNVVCLRKYDRNTFNKLRELAAKLQITIFKYWGDSVFGKEDLN